MKSRILILCVLIFSLSNYSFAFQKFSPSVEVLTSNKDEGFTTSESILFVYKGDTHSVHYYLNLENKLKKAIKKQLKTNYNLGFCYELKSENPHSDDVSVIPVLTPNKEDYKTICYVSITDFKGWDNHLASNRKQYFKLNFNFIDSYDSLNQQIILEVKTLYTMTSKNKLISKTISNLLFKVE